MDATNLSRSLFFTTQLLELGVPMVVALNKADINTKKETKIDDAKLSELLGCPVVDTVSTNSSGLAEGVKAAIDAVRSLALSIGIPQHLSEIGVKEEDLHDLAVAAFNDVCTGSNPRKTSVEEIEELYRIAF